MEIMMKHFWRSIFGTHYLNCIHFDDDTLSGENGICFHIIYNRFDKLLVDKRKTDLKSIQNY